MRGHRKSTCGHSAGIGDHSGVIYQRFPGSSPCTLPRWRERNRKRAPVSHVSEQAVSGPDPSPACPRSPNSNDTDANTDAFILKHVFKVSLDFFLHSCSYRTHSSHERQKHSTEERAKQHDPHPTPPPPSIKTAQRTDPEHVTGDGSVRFYARPRSLSTPQLQTVSVYKSL